MDPYRPELYGISSEKFGDGVREGWGMECPKCKTADDIYIDATVKLRLYPGGHEAYLLTSDKTWDYTSHAHCGNCGFEGVAKDFKIEKRAEP
jgi:Zn ribbon nucleic-acid-binding protein